MSFAVVTFVDEVMDGKLQTSEIPVTWLTDDQEYCKWPPSNAHIYISKNKSPADDWNLFPVKVDCICDSLAQAKREIALMNSSSGEERGRGCRVVKPTTSFSPDESIPKTRRTVARYDRVSPPPRICIRTLAETGTGSNSNQQDDADPLMETLIHTFSSQAVDINSNSTTHHSASPESSNNILTNLDEDNQSESVAVPGHGCFWCKDTSAKILDALSQQNILLRDLIQRVTALELHKPSISTNSNFNYSLPCQNLQDLENLEKYITKKDQYTLFCEYIRNIGGNGGNDFVVRFMKTLLTNATGELCSWTGAKNNFKLMNLKIMKAAYETINSGNTQVTLKEFEMFIKEWLRHCKQRRMREDLK